MNQITSASRPFRGGVSRRGLMGCAACAAVAGQSGLAMAATAAGGDHREAVQQFAYGAVRLTGGPIKEHYDRIHAHYLALDNDRVLKVYRENVGLPAPGKDMGGWYDKTDFIAGHSFGQYVSGLARLGAGSGDQACHDKVRQLVLGFRDVIDKNPNPFPGPGSQNVWAAYVMDKYVVALVDAYRLSGVQEAKAMLPRVIDGCMPFVSPVSIDRVGKKDPPYDETYVLPENLFAVAEITGDRKYHDMAVRYLLDPEWFDPLARGENVLPAKHAYSHTIALSSGGQAYLSTGLPKYKAALQNAWTYLDEQRFASGGWGPDEQFVTPHKGQLYDKLMATTAHFETPCGAYADIKLARYLMRFTGDAKYGDGLERTLYNTVLATRLPDSDGDYPYYSTYNAGASKAFYHKKWPCCSGTLVQGVADYPLNVYFHDADALYVNLYTPSTVDWSHGDKAVRVEQETAYPAQDTATFRVRMSGSDTFALKLRIPAWAEGAQVLVNGKPAGDVRPGAFASLRRAWKDGDTVQVTLPQSFRTLPIDDLHPDTVAVMRGPVMYVGLNPWPGLEAERLNLPGGLTKVADSTDAWVQQVQGKQVVFTPYFHVQEESYNTYFLKA